jgi:hypothetical protein
MAVSVSSVKAASNTGFYTVTDVTLDNSYAEGGESLTAVQLGLAAVDYATCIVKNGSEAEATAVGSVIYDSTKELLVVNDYKTQKALAGAKDTSKVVVRVVAFGRQRAK